jgi:hypothetical protein
MFGSVRLKIFPLLGHFQSRNRYAASGRTGRSIWI